MFGLGTTEVIIILVIALLVFGPAKLPELGRQIGSFYREMRRMSGDVQRALDIDDYRYDSRYNNSYERSSYQNDTSSEYQQNDSTWSADNGTNYNDAPYEEEQGVTAAKTSTAAAVAPYGTEPYNGARPWSVTEDGGGEAAAGQGQDDDLYGYNGHDEEVTPTPVTTAGIPPGPPSRVKEQ